MTDLLKPRSSRRMLTNLLAMALLITSPLSSQAASAYQAKTNKETIIRSCPNRLCPVVQTMPKGTKFTWVMYENGYVNIANTTFWVAMSDIN